MLSQSLRSVQGAMGRDVYFPMQTPLQHPPWNQVPKGLNPLDPEHSQKARGVPVPLARPDPKSTGHKLFIHPLSVEHLQSPARWDGMLPSLSSVPKPSESSLSLASIVHAPWDASALPRSFLGAVTNCCSRSSLGFPERSQPALHHMRSPTRLPTDQPVHAPSNKCT